MKGYLDINPNIQPLDVYRLTEETGNLYKAISLMGKRSNQIGADVKRELNLRLSEFMTHGDSLEEVVENREQIEIARAYEAIPKPQIIAIAEFLNGDLEWEGGEL